MKNHQTLDLSFSSILKIFLTLLIFYFIFLIKDLIILFLFSLLLSFLLEEPIMFLERRGLSRFFSTAIIYILFVFFFFFFIYFSLPVFFEEIKNFFFLIPDYLKKIENILSFLGIKSFDLFSFLFNEWFKKDWQKILEVIRSFFSGILSFFVFCFLSFFISLEKNLLPEMIKSFAPKKYEEVIFSIFERVKRQTTLWFGTKIISSFIVGLLTFLLCVVFGVNYAISFGLMAFILNLLPVLGPLIVGILLFITSFFDSFLKSILVTIGFSVIQLIEGNILTPILLKEFIQIPYLVIFLSFIIGGKVFGFLGAFFSIPLFVIVFEFWREFLREKETIE